MLHFFESTPESRNYVITREMLLAIANTMQNPYMSCAAGEKFIFPGSAKIDQIKADFIERDWLFNGKKRLGQPKLLTKDKNFHYDPERTMIALNRMTTPENAKKILAAHSQNPTYLVSNTVSFGMEGGIDQCDIIIKMPDEKSVTHNLIVTESGIQLLSHVEKFNVFDSKTLELIGHLHIPVSALFTLIQIDENTWGFQLDDLKTANEVFNRMLRGQLVSSREVRALIQRPARKAEPVQPSALASKDASRTSPEKKPEPILNGLDAATHRTINSREDAAQIMSFLRMNSKHVQSLGQIISVLHKQNLLTVSLLDELVGNPDDLKSMAKMLQQFDELRLFDRSVNAYFSENNNGIYCISKVADLIANSNVQTNLRLLAKNVSYGASIWIMLSVLVRFGRNTDENIKLILQNPKNCSVIRPFFENLLTRPEVASNAELADKLFKLFMKYPLHSAHIYNNPKIYSVDAIDIFEKEIAAKNKDYSLPSNQESTSEIAETVRKAFEYVTSMLPSRSYN